MAAHLVEHRALHREDAPVRLVGRVRALEHVERLLEVAGIGERAAVGAEQRLVVRIMQRGGFQNRGGLRALAGRAQRLRVADRGVGDRADWRGIARRAPRFAAPFGLAARRGLEEIEPVVSVEPMVLQPASAPAISATAVSERRDEGKPRAQS